MKLAPQSSGFSIYFIESANHGQTICAGVEWKVFISSNLNILGMISNSLIQVCLT